jgi:hypothetical protein
MSDNKVVFLAHRNDTPTAMTEVLVCGSCQNKTWTAEYGVRGSNFPRLRCAACGEAAGYFGWVEDKEALTE